MSPCFISPIVSLFVRSWDACRGPPWFMGARGECSRRHSPSSLPPTDPTAPHNRQHCQQQQPQIRNTKYVARCDYLGISIVLQGDFQPTRDHFCKFYWYNCFESLLRVRIEILKFFVLSFLCTNNVPKFLYKSQTTNFLYDFLVTILVVLKDFGISI